MPRAVPIPVRRERSDPCAADSGFAGQKPSSRRITLRHRPPMPRTKRKGDAALKPLALLAAGDGFAGAGAAVDQVQLSRPGISTTSRVTVHRYASGLGQG